MSGGSFERVAIPVVELRHFGLLRTALVVKMPNVTVRDKVATLTEASTQIIWQLILTGYCTILTFNNPIKCKTNGGTIKKKNLLLTSV
jgi:hypothetical protein